MMRGRTATRRAALPDRAVVIGFGRPRAAANPDNESQRLRFAEWHYAERRRRVRLMPPDLFGEPAWDILLDLYIASRRNRCVSTSSACLGADVPPTTALRWIMILEDRGLVLRSGDTRDHRRTLVRLSRRGDQAVTEWLDAGLASLGKLALHEGSRFE